MYFSNHRDLNDQLHKHFSVLMDALLHIIPNVAYSSNNAHDAAKIANPELTGKLFECVSHLLK